MPTRYPVAAPRTAPGEANGAPSATPDSDSLSNREPLILVGLPTALKSRPADGAIRNVAKDRLKKLSFAARASMARASFCRWSDSQRGQGPSEEAGASH